MTAGQPPGALSPPEDAWHTIDWYTVHRTVQRLQARIVKAVRESRWGKVRALPHLLSHSFSGKAVAVKRVTSNDGKRTPGVDGVIWDTPEKTFLGKVRQVVKANKQATAVNLIAQLNPMIRGWANYHRHVMSKKTFYHVDTAIFKALWSWAKRRHPKKPRRWVADKYFATRNGRAWTFVGTSVDKKGKPYELTLVRAGDTPIKRHVKVKGAANPYDPQWEM